METEKKRTREWLVLISSLLLMMSVIYFLSAKEAYSTTTDSTNVTPPSPIQKSMQCFGAITYVGNPTWRGDVLCQPLTDSTKDATCNADEVATAVRWDADWASVIHCSSRCQKVDMSQSNCQWV